MDTKPQRLMCFYLYKINSHKNLMSIINKLLKLISQSNINLICLQNLTLNSKHSELYHKYQIMNSVQTIKQIKLAGKWCHIGHLKEEVNKIQKHTLDLHSKLSKLTDILALHYQKFVLKNQELIQYETIADNKDRSYQRLNQKNNRFSQKINQIGVKCHKKKQQIQAKKKDVDKETICEHQQHMTSNDIAKNVQNLVHQIEKGRYQLHQINVKKQHYRNVCTLNQQIQNKKHKIELQLLKIQKQKDFQAIKIQQTSVKIEKISKIIDEKQSNNANLRINIQNQKKRIFCLRIQQSTIFDQRRELLKIRKQFQQLNKQNIFADTQIKNQQQSLQFKNNVLKTLTVQLKQAQDSNYLRQNYKQFYYANQKKNANFQVQKQQSQIHTLYAPAVKFQSQELNKQLPGFYIIQSQQQQSKQMHRYQYYREQKDCLQSQQIVSAASSRRKNGSIGSRNSKKIKDKSSKTLPYIDKIDSINISNIKKYQPQIRLQQKVQSRETFKKKSHSLRQNLTQVENKDNQYSLKASQELDALISRYLQIKEKSAY